jgi:hypothetical protein
MRRRKTDVRRENTDVRWVGFHPLRKVSHSHCKQILCNSGGRLARQKWCHEGGTSSIDVPPNQKTTQSRVTKLSVYKHWVSWFSAESHSEECNSSKYHSTKKILAIYFYSKCHFGGYYHFECHSVKYRSAQCRGAEIKTAKIMILSWL